MRKVLLLALTLTVSPALAAEPVLDNPSLVGKTRYERCLYLSDRNPRGAYEAASAWQLDTGGTPAGHCAALALIGLHRYAEAAARLDALGRDASAGDLVIRSQILDQAGNAWLLAGKGDLAAAAFTKALSYSINDPDILTDRAQARALNKDWAGAETDLNAALVVYPTRTDLLVLRASARHALGKKAEAMADANRALQLQPNNGDALLERGNIKFSDGDTPGARADWQQVLRVSNGSAASTAKQRLDDTLLQR
jgi:tetratricopeptide (TPR) repeat protein